jgi:hypothetical protein
LATGCHGIYKKDLTYQILVELGLAQMVHLTGFGTVQHVAANLSLAQP